MRDDAPGDLQDKVIFGLSKVHDEMLPHIQNFRRKSKCRERNQLIDR